MLGLKLNHVSKRGPRSWLLIDWLTEDIYCLIYQPLDWLSGWSISWLMEFIYKHEDDISLEKKKLDQLAMNREFKQ